MRKVPEHVQAAEAEAIRLGASFSYQLLNAKFVAIVTINGHSRKLFMSKTPSDHRVLRKVEQDVRHLVRDMA